MGLEIVGTLDALDDVFAVLFIAAGFKGGITRGDAEREGRVEPVQKSGVVRRLLRIGIGRDKLGNALGDALLDHFIQQ